MSPIALDENLHHIDRIAIIGAGPCGLAGAKYLGAEKKFSKIEIFEQRAHPGGVWNYTALNVVDDEFTVPRTKPTTSPDTAIWTAANESSSHRGDDKHAQSAAQFVSPVYDQLETNIPHSLMNFSDLPFPQDCSLFPPHQLVRRYLHDYARDLEPILSLQTQVLSVTPRDPRDDGGWDVKVLDLRTKQERTDRFDAVLIASGHYNDPFIPDIKGLAEFDRAHPGSISHSKFYRRPDQYAGKKVIIVGNSASGIDLSAQISTVCQLPVIVSEKAKKPNPTVVAPDMKSDGKQGSPSVMKTVPEITEFIPESRSVVYADGSTDSDVDAVVFCTGYFYSFPFLKLDGGGEENTTTSSSSSTISTTTTTTTTKTLPPIITDGSHAAHLYQHILYTRAPTLAFLGIPQRIVPFPVSEAQAAWVSRIWSGRLPVPTLSEMQIWEDDLLVSSSSSTTTTSTGSSRSGIHNMTFPKDVEYINWLHDESLRAKPRPAHWGLENDGKGKIPPYWGADKAWMRERFPLIKVAARALGDGRHAVRSLEELGFDYVAWKKEQQQQQ